MRLGRSGLCPAAAGPDRSADPGAGPADLQRARRAQRRGAAALRGQGARGSPQRRDRADRRHRLRRPQHLRRPDPDADARPAGGRRPALQQLPHHRAVLADAERAQDRPQPPHHQHRLDHGDRDGLPRQHRAGPEQRGAAGRDAAAQRLQHRRVRQVARDRGLGDQRLGSLRPLADPSGLRQVLRLHRRRDRPVVPAGLRRRHPGHPAGSGGLPLHRRHDQPGDRLGQGPAVADAGQALLRLLRHRRRPRAAPRPEGVGRQVQGPVRQGLGPGAAGDDRAPEEDGGHPRRHRAGPEARGHRGLGLAARRASDGCSPARPRCSPASWSRPTTRSAASSTRSRTSASWTTPCSSTSPATTAPAPRAASSACTTR